MAAEYYMKHAYNSEFTGGAAIRGTPCSCRLFCPCSIVDPNIAPINHVTGDLITGNDTGRSPHPTASANSFSPYAGSGCFHW